jgi:hypothetical protein
MAMQKIQSRKVGKRRLIVFESLLEALDVEAPPAFADRVTVTIGEAKSITGLGANTLYKMMNLTGGKAA